MKGGPLVVDIPLGWKPLNLERYDGTTNPDEHLDAFLTPIGFVSATLTSLRQVDDEFLQKFMDNLDELSSRSEIST